MRSRFARASSAIVKYWESSVMSPSRFHVLPVREISDSRETTPATIHCCSVASSRHVLVSPFSRRTSHWRSPESFGPDGTSPMLIGASDSTRGAGAGAGLGADGGFGRGGSGCCCAGRPTLVGARLRILNMCPQLVHLTVTPPGFSRLSSSSYSVWHFSQRTSMCFRRFGGY